MRFYTNQHRYYCNRSRCQIDVRLYLGPTGRDSLAQKYALYSRLVSQGDCPLPKDMAVAVECIFTWYWLAVSEQENIAFVGHALYMKAIHGGKANEKITPIRLRCCCAAVCCRWPTSIPL